MADSTERMEKTLSSLKDSLNTIRTGRANASIFDKVRVDYYGTKTPLNQVATIQIPEARSVIIQPFDKSLITEIEKAILASDLGLNPSNDGKVIRISIPALTADRRKELVKQAKTIAENSRTSIRNIRRDGNDDLKKQQKAGEITEDDLKKAAHMALTDKERGYGRWNVQFEEGALEPLIETANGDARSLLNALELAVETTPEVWKPDASPCIPPEGSTIYISRETAEESIVADFGYIVGGSVMTDC